MKLILTEKEKTELLTTCLQHFWESLSMWEHNAEYTDKQYRDARQAVLFNKTDICQEDVFCYIILKSKGLNIIDLEDEENIILFNSLLFNQNFDKCNYKDVINILNEDADYDFTTTDNVLQCLIFGEVIYG
jgi:hypothetical protein